MANDIVKASELGLEFDIGTIQANKIRLKIGDGLVIAPDGTISVAPESTGVPDIGSFTALTVGALGNLDNWNPPNLATTAGYILDVTDNFDLTGIAAPVPAVQRDLWLLIETEKTIKLKNEKTNSLTPNQFFLVDNADYTLKKQSLTRLTYVPYLSKWMVVGTKS